MKRPSFQFYPGDWRRDPGVQALTFHDRGVWIELLCIMHESSERGVLILNGKPMTEEVIARVIGLDKQILATTLSTLLDFGVIRLRVNDGAFYSKRMVEDEKLTEIRRNAGKQGGNPVLLNQKSTTLLNQKPTPSSSSSSSSSVVNTPPNPLTGGTGEAQTESFQLDAKPERTAKRERKPAQRNPIMDALATYAEGVTDLSQVTPSAWKQIAKAASDIKTVCPTVTADEIRRRVINYSLSMPNATCTSTAIAKHWARCDDARKPGSTVAETEEEAWARKAAEERKSWGMIPAN